MASARVIEVGDLTAGIVVPEPDGFRFFAAERPFYALEGALFRTIDQAARAARERLRSRKPPGWRGSPRCRRGTEEDMLLKAEGLNERCCTTVTS